MPARKAARSEGTNRRSFTAILLTTVVMNTVIPAASAADQAAPSSQASEPALKPVLEQQSPSLSDTAGSTEIKAPPTPSSPSLSAGPPGAADKEAPQSQAATPAAPPAPESPALRAPARTPRVIWKPGMELSAGTDTDDLVPTDDVELARKQVAAYPDNPEASFILAVALTRTSRVEEALQEVRRARKLAEAKGGPAYFDKMIESYEDMLRHHPRENRVRYGLAWAYYMKAYMLAKYSRRAAKAAADPAAPTAPSRKTNVWELAAAAANGKIPASAPHIQGALEKADPAAAPQIRKYYELALGKLDELLKQKPDDIWARVYRAFLRAEYSGNLEEAMTEWRACQAQAPNNPAPYFFLGEAYLKQGNLKECINNISKAIALRAIGN